MDYVLISISLGNVFKLVLFTQTCTCQLLWLLQSAKGVEICASKGR